MSPPSNLRGQLLRDEGLRLRPYRDSVGKLTIGVGRNLDDAGISVAEADMLLDNDISRATAAVLSRIPWTNRLDEVRRAVLINMCFQLGIVGLLGFTKMLAACEQQDWATAVREGLDSVWHRQTPDRCERLMRQLESGQWV